MKNKSFGKTNCFESLISMGVQVTTGSDRCDLNFWFRGHRNDLCPVAESTI